MKKKPFAFKLIISLSFVVLCASFFSRYLSAPLWDADFWWHIATGRYIVNEGRLPETDPLSYTSTMEENRNSFPTREKFFLKQYWLAQVFFYLIYDAIGPGGIVLLRSLVLLLTALIILLHLKRSGARFYISYLFTFLFFLVAVRSIGERPVLFTILFTSVVLSLLDDFMDGRTKILFLLIPVMLLWANMHGGFILGDVIISVFVFSEILKILFKKSDLTRKNKRVFFTATGTALAVSLLNPTGWDAFFIAFSPKYDIFLERLQEYMPPFFYYSQKIADFDFKYFTLALVFPVILILRNGKIGLARIIVLSGFFLMSLKANRYVTFFAVAGCMIMGKEADALIKGIMDAKVGEGFRNKVEHGFAVLMLISAVFFAAGYFKYENFTPGKLNRIYAPVSAVDFIEKNNIQGNIFNDYGYGGYIAWRLYPRKTFIDTRALNKTVINEYEWIVEARKKVRGIETTNKERPLWGTLLKHYKINVVLLAISDLYGSLFPVIAELNESEEWTAAFFDRRSIVFLRNTEGSRAVVSKVQFSKSDVNDFLIANFAYKASRDTLNPRHLISLGYIFDRLNRHEDAAQAYRYALRRWDDPDLEKKINEIEAEIERQKKSLEKGSAGAL